MDLETLLKYSGMEKDVSESKMSELDIEAQDNSREDFVDMYSKTFGSAKAAGKFWDDSKEANESVETEAVGTAADPIMDLCDEVGCDPDHPIFKEIVRYMSGDQIKDFVDDYRRHHEMNASFESDEVEATEESDEAVEEATEEVVEGSTDVIMFKGKQVDMKKLDYDMKDISDGDFMVNAPVFYTDGSEVADEDMEELEGMQNFQDWVMTDYMDESVEENTGLNLDDLLTLAGQFEVNEDSEEITNTGREEQMKTDRDSVKIDMVKPAIEKMLSSYEADAKEWNDTYAELEKEVRAKGVTDPKEIEIEVFNMDDDIVSYVNIDDLEDKIDAIKQLMKQGDADGHDIVDMASSGPLDTSAREGFMRELKTAIKQDYPDIYSKLFMYDIGEAVTETETDVQETVEVAVDDLAKLMALAGQQADTQAQANELEEYSNSPDEDYMDADMQLNKLSGGLNGPKAQHKKEYPGDNPLAAKLADQLKDLMSK